MLVSLAIWLTALLLMPSARATAMPLVERCGSSGLHAPWKSWLTGLRPLSVCWPREITSCLDMGSGIHSKAPACRSFAYVQSEGTFGGGTHVSGVQRQAGEGQAAHQIAQRGGDFVPQQVIHHREITADHQPRREQKHVHHR